MPFITAKKNTLLATLPNQPHLQPLNRLAKVYEGGILGIIKVSAVNSQLAEITLAGPYTWHDHYPTIETGVTRYINPVSWHIPEDAWEKPEVPALPAPTSNLSQPETPGIPLLPPEVAQLNHFYEGCQRKLADGRIQAYPDPRAGSGGLPVTIGWGSTYYKDGSAIQMGDIITQTEADELYDYICHKDFWIKLQSTIPYWDDMTHQQRAALTSFAYNNGADFYGSPNHRTITRNLKEKDWQAVPGTLMMYRNPGENVEVGLGRRRYAEAKVWCGEVPTTACTAAAQEIQTAQDCEPIEQRLKTNPPAVAGFESMVTISTPIQPSGPRQLHVIAGMKGPKSHPDAHGFKPGDYHLVANDAVGKIKCYDYDGTLMWELSCLCRGQFEDNYFGKHGDTPAGLYKCGQIYRDYEQAGDHAGYTRDRMSYGWFSFDLVELESQEANLGRAGIMIHGGGSGCGWPGAWKPKQPMFATLGCIRMHNQDLRDKVVPLYDQPGATLFVSVYQ